MENAARQGETGVGADFGFFNRRQRGDKRVHRLLTCYDDCFAFWYFGQNLHRVQRSDHLQEDVGSIIFKRMIYIAESPIPIPLSRQKAFAFSSLKAFLVSKKYSLSL